VRIILNKSDQIDQQQLMRVYGALMWNLGKVFRSPEVCKVYVGSFNCDAPIREDKNPFAKAMFEAEQKELLNALYETPQRSCDRKINEFVKRVRSCKIHMLLLGHMRKQMPTMFGAQKAQEKMMSNMGEHFTQASILLGWTRRRGEATFRTHTRTQAHTNAYYIPNSLVFFLRAGPARAPPARWRLPRPKPLP
jgi:hypothetical protein